MFLSWLLIKSPQSLQNMVRKVIFVRLTAVLEDTTSVPSMVGNFCMAASQPWRSIPEPELQYSNIHQWKSVLLVDKNHAPPNERQRWWFNRFMIHMITFCRLQKGCWTVEGIKYQLTYLCCKDAHGHFSHSFRFFHFLRLGKTVEDVIKKLRKATIVHSLTHMAIQHGLFKASVLKRPVPKTSYRCWKLVW